MGQARLELGEPLSGPEERVLAEVGSALALSREEAAARLEKIRVGIENGSAEQDGLKQEIAELNEKIHACKFKLSRVNLKKTMINSFKNFKNIKL